jgi:hypothetical protein
VKIKLIAILVLAAALAGGWKWNNPKGGGTSAATPAAYVQAYASTTDGWSWGEEAS